MADNITTTAGVLATKDIGGVHHPKNLLTDSAGVEAIGDVGASPGANTILGRLLAIFNKLSASIAVTGTFWQATQPVSAASLPLPAGAATATLQGSAVQALGALSSAKRWSAITPSDTVTLSPVPTAIYVGGAGNVALQGDDGVTVVFAVQAGQILLCSPARVMLTNTTATGLVSIRN